MSFTVRMQDGDIAIDSSGADELVSRAEKAAQDLLEEILLPYDATRDRGNEMFQPDGTLTGVVGSPQIGAAAIRASLRSAVTRFMRAQAADPDTDDSEFITRIKSLVVSALNNDPTRYGFFLAVEVADELISLARAISMRHLGDSPKPLVGGGDP